MAQEVISEAEKTYTASNIQVLEGLDPVRKRPGMYIGSTDYRGLHHLVWEVVDNSVDEALAGYCRNIEVKIDQNNVVTVSDDGRGIPTDMHPTKQRPALEIVMTVLHAGGKFGGGGYKVSGGLHGVGASVVNALSNWLRVEVRRDGKLYSQEYHRGIPTADMQIREMAIEEINEYPRGTRTIWLADDTIFDTLAYNFETMAQRFRETCFLTKGLRIRMVDERIDKELTFYFEGGVMSFVRHMNRMRGVVQQKPFYIQKRQDEVEVEVAFQYTEGYNDSIHAFANNINTVDGGTHVTGFRTALTRTINNYARKNNLLKEKDENFTGDDVRQGLTAIISVKLADPQFEGQTKGKLGNANVKSAVESVVGDSLVSWLEENPNESRRIIEKCLTAARIREAQSKIKDSIIRKGAFDGLSLPGKLADCTEKDPGRSELFIVEGDSAGGSAKQGRDRRFQAILPLRGKILNVERAALDKMLGNAEIRALVTALGAGIGDSFEAAKLRYHRIVIMTDADVDGSHIRTLLLTFFFRNMKDLIANGHLYIAQPPLYLIKHSKEKHYAYSDEQRDEVIKRLNLTKSPDIQRYKGLGEMNAEQLWETTMNPSARTLLQVSIEDAAAADETFGMLMGDEVPPRKQFIITHSKNVKNLDI
ncbi:MAG TPA: DNA topoisomerase (ATP-hydrolyzing) subunit B [Chloroflexia bacterium]|nr:DNA topoisomerase (ATP-hydrolyzing) subunit B [Chloroflexia bacterium]